MTDVISVSRVYLDRHSPPVGAPGRRSLHNQPMSPGQAMCWIFWACTLPLGALHAVSSLPESRFAEWRTSLLLSTVLIAALALGFVPAHHAFGHVHELRSSDTVRQR